MRIIFMDIRFSYKNDNQKLKHGENHEMLFWFN